MIKAIFFDFDGTLSDRQANVYAIFRDYLSAHLDLPELEFEGILQDLMLFDCNGIIAMKERLIPFMKKYGELFPADFAQEFAGWYNTHMHNYTVLRPETIEVLEHLRPQYSLGIISNGDSLEQHSKIAKVAVEKYFDLIIVSGDLGIHKPDPQIFQTAMNELQLEPSECMMVGDVFANDVVGALKAGMLPVWICVNKERPCACDVKRISDLRQLYTILDEVNKV